MDHEQHLPGAKTIDMRDAVPHIRKGLQSLGFCCNGLAGMIRYLCGPPMRGAYDAAVDPSALSCSSVSCAGPVLWEHHSISLNLHAILLSSGVSAILHHGARVLH